MVAALVTAGPNSVHDKPFSVMPATGAPSITVAPEEPDLPIHNSIAPGFPVPVGSPPCICVVPPSLLAPNGVGRPNIPPYSNTARDTESVDSGSLLPPIQTSNARLPPPWAPALHTSGRVPSW